MNSKMLTDWENNEDAAEKLYNRAGDGGFSLYE